MDQPEEIKAWIVECTLPGENRMDIVIGTEADAEHRAAELWGKYEDRWVSGPYEYTIAIKP